MAEFRTVHTKIWDDPWFEHLPDDGKLLWIYLFTNRQASVAGIYVLRSSVAAAETGIDRNRVDELFKAFEESGKVEREHHVVWVKKMRDYQGRGSEKVQKRIASDTAQVPDCQLKSRYCEHYGMPLPDTLSNPEPIPYRYPIQPGLSDTDTDTDTETDTETDTDTVGDADFAARFLARYRSLFLNGGQLQHTHREKAIAAIEKLMSNPRYVGDEIAMHWLEQYHKTQLADYRNDNQGRTPPLQYIVACMVGWIAKEAVPWQQGGGE